MRLDAAIAHLPCRTRSLSLPSAQATYDPVGSGKTKLTLDKGFLSFLAQNEHQAHRQARAPSARATPITLPITGGKIDPTSGKGEIEQRRHARLRRRPKSTVPLREIRVKTKHDAPDRQGRRAPS